MESHNLVRCLAVGHGDFKQEKNLNKMGRSYSGICNDPRNRHADRLYFVADYSSYKTGQREELNRAHQGIGE